MSIVHYVPIDRESAVFLGVGFMQQGPSTADGSQLMDIDIT